LTKTLDLRRRDVSREVEDKDLRLCRGLLGERKAADTILPPNIGFFQQLSEFFPAYIFRTAITREKSDKKRG